jgi:hypothetical protein
VRDAFAGVQRDDRHGFVAEQGAASDALIAWADVRLGDHDKVSFLLSLAAAADTTEERSLRGALFTFGADACMVAGDAAAVGLLERARAEADVRKERWWLAETIRLQALADAQFGDGSRVTALLDDAEAVAREQGADLLLDRVVATRATLAPTRPAV